MPAHKLSALESLLFTSGEPLSLGRLAKTLKISDDEVKTFVQTLTEKYEHDSERGLMLIVKDKKIMLTAKPENTSFVETLTKNAIQENLSKAALEVLAIIAYRSPITRVEIETIRGVNCSFTLRNLLLRDLIERQGNPEDSRGYVYFLTFRFLQSLGLKNTAQLPDYPGLSQDERLKILFEEDTKIKDE